MNEIYSYVYAFYLTLKKNHLLKINDNNEDYAIQRVVNMQQNNFVFV